MNKMTYDEAEKQIKSKIGNNIPVSVIEKFLDFGEHMNVTVPSYTVDIKENNGVSIIEIIFNSFELGAEEFKYVITINNQELQYKMEGYHFDKGNPTIYKQIARELVFDSNAWDNQPGWLLSKEEIQTDTYNENDKIVSDKLSLNDTKKNETLRYDEFGVSMAHEYITIHYPVREDRSFSFGLPKVNFRYADKQKISRVYRTSPFTAVSYEILNDCTGRRIDEKTIYYYFDSERDLGDMSFYGSRRIDEEEHDKKVNDCLNLSEEQLGKLLENTSFSVREGLLNRYYPDMIKKEGYKR